MIAAQNAIIRLRNLLVHEFPLFFAALIAGLNAAQGHSTVAYGAAAATAALRFVVSPAFESAALKSKVVDPALIEAVSNALVARDEARRAMHAPDISATP